jgi:hypothetical protein
VVAQLADIASALQLPPPAAPQVAADPAPWPALLEALQRLAEARPEAPAAVQPAEPVVIAAPSPPATPLAEDLQAGLAPLVQLLVASQAQQEQVSQTLAAFAGWARQQVEGAAGASTTTARRPRVRRASTPEERALDEALMRHFYGESLPPEATDDAPAGSAPMPPPLP